MTFRAGDCNRRATRAHRHRHRRHPRIFQTHSSAGRVFWPMGCVTQILGEPAPTAAAVVLQPRSTHSSAGRVFWPMGCVTQILGEPAPTGNPYFSAAMTSIGVSPPIDSPTGLYPIAAPAIGPLPQPCSMKSIAALASWLAKLLHIATEWIFSPQDH